MMDAPKTYTNRSFLVKAIARAQKEAPGSPFCQALHEYIAREAGIVWDDARALFWVDHPDGPQVAVWLMPVAMQFEPNSPNKDTPHA